MMKPVLQEENDGKLFILNNSTMLIGKAVNISCIGPKSYEDEYSYDISAKSMKSPLQLQSFSKNVQQIAFATDYAIHCCLKKTIWFIWFF
jgi:hypothetical protein